MCETTDPLARLALQVAAQLPESIEEARKVLALAGMLVDDFMIPRTIGSKIRLLRPRVNDG